MYILITEKNSDWGISKHNTIKEAKARLKEGYDVYEFQYDNWIITKEIERGTNGNSLGLKGYKSLAR